VNGPAPVAQMGLCPCQHVVPGRVAHHYEGRVSRAVVACRVADHLIACQRLNGLLGASQRVSIPGPRSVHQSAGGPRPSDEPVPPDLRPVGYPDGTDHGIRSRPRCARPQEAETVDRMGTVLLSLQHDGTAGGDSPLRVYFRGPSRRASSYRASLFRRLGITSLSRLRDGETIHFSVSDRQQIARQSPEPYRIELFSVHPIFRKLRNSNDRVYVRLWLLADLWLDGDLGPLYPRKRTFFSTGVYVCL